MSIHDKLPRILKEPTGWIILLLTAGFFYVQWPTQQPKVSEPEYVSQQLDNGFTVVWEDQPVLQSESDPLVWGLTRKGMSFLVQSEQLTQPFDRMVEAMAESDRKTVAGAVQEPLVISADQASYAFFDAESRIQAHRVYLRGNEWVKVSVLYKPSMESRVQRAAAFFEQARF